MDILTVLNVDMATEYTVKCEAEEGEGAGIYQWVVSTQDGYDFAFSQHTVCRTGDLWNKPPVCPWMYCVNADCSVCEDDWDSHFESMVDLNEDGNTAEWGIFKPEDQFGGDDGDI